LLENIKDINHRLRFITKKINSKLFWVEKKEKDIKLEISIRKMVILKYKYLSWKSVSIKEEYTKVTSVFDILFNNKIIKSITNNIKRKIEEEDTKNQ